MSAMSEAPPGMLEEAKTELETLLRLMTFEAAVEASMVDDGEEVLLHIESEDAGRLIGRQAQVLNALQYILNRILYDKNHEALHCIVDVERYRERRKDRLFKEALDKAAQVKQSGQSARFSPMQAADRRVIHQALKDHEGIETYSEEADEQGRKCLVISLVEKTAG